MSRHASLPPGILDRRPLPHADFEAQWESIILDPDLKARLANQAVLNFVLRPKVERAVVPLHGIIVMVGPPGTGKTTIARGLASRTASILKSLGDFTYLEVEPHGLASASLGKSQQAMRDLLGRTVAETAATGPTIVLLDEVETLAADRSKMSLEANPVDVHRATDAVLAQLDHLASTYPNLLFIATSNFPQAIDAAFLSRADLVVDIGLPNEEACRDILISTLAALAKTYPKLKQIATHADFDVVVRRSVGLDGRRLRKVVLAALASSRESTLDPNRLTVTQLLASIDLVHRLSASPGSTSASIPIRAEASR